MLRTRLLFSAKTRRNTCEFQHPNFFATDVTVLETSLLEVETCTNNISLRSSHMSPFKSLSKPIHRIS